MDAELWQETTVTLSRATAKQLDDKVSSSDTIVFGKFDSIETPFGTHATRYICNGSDQSTVILSESESTKESQLRGTNEWLQLACLEK